MIMRRHSIHARYGNDEATFVIATLEMLSGGLPRRATALVLEWAALHRAELAANWERARRGEPLAAIAPLE
jgi:hypothetical protein